MPLQQLRSLYPEAVTPSLKNQQGQVQALGGWRDCRESKGQGREEAQLGAEGSPTPSSALLFSLFFPGPQHGETLALVGEPGHPPRAPGLAPSQP